MSDTFIDYQQRTTRFAKYDEGINKFLDLPRDQQKKILLVLYCLLGAAGEAGEALNKIKKVLRGDTDLDTILPGLLDESGDNLWYLSEFHNVLGCLLSVTADANILKLESRKARGTLQGSGDNR